MFKPDRIEFLEVKDLGDNRKLMVSLWGVEADMEEDWQERRVFIKPDMFTFNACQLFIEDGDNKRTILVDANADHLPKGLQFFTADKFFDWDNQGSAVWNAIEDHVNEVGNEEIYDRDWEADAEEREADFKLHMQREEGF